MWPNSGYTKRFQKNDLNDSVAENYQYQQTDPQWDWRHLNDSSFQSRKQLWGCGSCYGCVYLPKGMLSCWVSICTYDIQNTLSDSKNNPLTYATRLLARKPHGGCCFSRISICEIVCKLYANNNNAGIRLTQSVLLIWKEPWSVAEHRLHSFSRITRTRITRTRTTQSRKCSAAYRAFTEQQLIWRQEVKIQERNPRAAASVLLQCVSQSQV